jgi:hypothetical protein
MELSGTLGPSSGQSEHGSGSMLMEQADPHAFENNQSGFEGILLVISAT